MTNSFINNYFDLTNKVIIITGANTGLGLAYAKAFILANAQVVIAHYDDDLAALKSFLAENKKEALLIKGDLTKDEDQEKLISATLAKYGKIDVLVNNAGMIIREPILEFKKSSWEKVLNINLNAVWFLSQKVAKILQKQKQGKIINVASMLSFQGGKFVPSYTAAKHGIAGLTKAFANELAKDNIQINAIAPGYIETANTAPIRADQERNQEILKRIPAAHWGKTEELMGTMLFLAAKASDYVNGAIIPVDGGWLAR